MAIPVLPYIPSMRVKQSLVRQFQSNKLNDGYVIEDSIETPFSRANGVGGISSYRGLNRFSIGYNKTLNGASQLADNLWIWFMARLDNLNEPFYFYNPTEYSTPDLTGTIETGRYFVKLEDPNQVLNRTLFMHCLFSYQLTFIECKNFDVVPGEEVDDEEGEVDTTGMIEIPIEILDIGLSPYGSPHYFHRSYFYYDPDKYDHVVNIPIEVVSHGPVAFGINIVDHLTGAVCGHIDVPAGYTTPWFRTNLNANGDDFVPYETTGNRQYALYLIATNVRIAIYSVRLIVRQLPTMLKTRVQFPLIHSPKTESSAYLTAINPLIYALHDFSNATYHVPSSRGTTGYWKWDPTKFTADHITFDLEVCSAIMWSGPITSALFSLAWGKIAATEQVNDYFLGWNMFDANCFIQRASFGTAALVSFDTHEFQIKNEPGILHAKLFHAAIYIDISADAEGGIENFEIYHRFCKTNVYSVNYKSGAQRIYVPKTRTNFVHEVCGAAPGGFQDIYVGNDGENTENPTEPEAVVGSGADLQVGAGTKMLARSGEFTLTKGSTVVTPDLDQLSGSGSIACDILVTPIDIAQEKIDAGL